MIDRVLRETAERFGTPVYIYDLAELRSRAADLRSHLPESALLYYSLKANPHPSVVAELRRAGCRAEVSSPGELAAALEAGHDPQEVLYTGPGKSLAEMTEALKQGVTWFSCESAAELRRLGPAAVEAGRRARVLLRLQPPSGTKAGLSMGDGRQFGFTPEDAVRACADLPEGIELHGCHVYLGSQLPGNEALSEAFVTARSTVEAVGAAAGVPLGLVDLGGGFPWPYATPGEGADLTGLRARLEDLLSGWDAPRVAFESGRRLAASAGHLLTTVLDVKERPEGTIVVLDAGINVLGGMSGLGRVLRPAAGFLNLSAGSAGSAGSAEDDREMITADVVGPLCTPLDRLAVRATMPRPREGDVLCIPNVGAYGLTASLTGFLSRPPVVEVVHDGDRLIGASRRIPVTEDVVAAAAG